MSEHVQTKSRFCRSANRASYGSYVHVVRNHPCFRRAAGMRVDDDQPPELSSTEPLSFTLIDRLMGTKLGSPEALEIAGQLVTEVRGTC